MDAQPSLERGEILALASEIVVAYAGNNAIETPALTELIGGVFAKLSELASDEQAIPEALVPAVPIRRSVTDDYIVCLEDGKKLKMLKRHLMTSYGMTPEESRARWGLKSDYPMVAPGYSARRQELAKAIGLGRKPKELEPAPPPPAKPRGRRKAASA
ncbi:MucR family transcriptional regulator [Amaricoccus sp. W119]|uniref:MucR family transcriptional regulator n=1 Tax=Amaricoccus sp. W119 TaxID=3391833 RepID=UPI0039A6BC55